MSNPENDKISIDLDIRAGVGLSIVQDINSPLAFSKIGLIGEKFKLHTVFASNHFFSTRNDNSRKVDIDKYLGLEFLKPTSYWDNGRDDNGWGGLGAMYCIDNKSPLHDKDPFKVYAVYYFGVISVTAEQIWSDFSYTGLSIRFEY